MSSKPIQGYLHLIFFLLVGNQARILHDSFLTLFSVFYIMSSIATQYEVYFGQSTIRNYFIENAD